MPERGLRVCSAPLPTPAPTEGMVLGQPQGAQLWDKPGWKGKWPPAPCIQLL